MATLQTVDIGTEANDGRGDPLLHAFDKVNDNDTALNEELGSHTQVLADIADAGTLAGQDAVSGADITDGTITAGNLFVDGFANWPDGQRVWTGEDWVVPDAESTIAKPGSSRATTTEWRSGCTHHDGPASWARDFIGAVLK